MRLLIILILFLPFELYSQDRIELSILEQRYEDWNKPDSINPFILRFCFFKYGKEWKVADNKLISKEGKVCFDGKTLGSIQIGELYNSTVCETCKFMFDDTHYIIKDCKNVPKVGKPNGIFSGFLDSPVYRPLVVNSVSNSKDPEFWKPFSPTKNDSTQILKYFKGKMLPQKYMDLNNDELFKCLNKSYISKDSIKLVSANLFGKYKYPCDTCEGVIKDTGDNSWFLLKNNTIEYIGSDMILVDAGDYDNDGRSEIIFMKQQYDYDAYVLFYNYKFQVELGWRYH